jgi:hypothetical protein
VQEALDGPGPNLREPVVGLIDLPGPIHRNPGGATVVEALPFERFTKLMFDVCLLPKQEVEEGLVAIGVALVDID